MTKTKKKYLIISLLTVIFAAVICAFTIQTPQAVHAADSADSIFGSVVPYYNFTIREDMSTYDLSFGCDLSNLSELNQSLINTVIDQIKEKDLQLKTKDDPMKAKDEQIKNLQKLLENSQVLLKQEQDKEMKKLSMETHFEEVDKKLLELKEKLAERRKIDIEIKEKDKEKFWSKVLKKSLSK